MKNSKFLISSLIFLTASLSFASAKFKGYSREPNSETQTLAEPIDRIEETPTEFLVLLHKHPAFYSFPKKKEYDDQVREYLGSRKKTQKPIQLVIDPKTAQIFTITDP